MSRYSGNRRRPSTQMRDNRVHEIYRQVISEIGSFKNVVSKSYIYEQIHQRTGLCVKTIAYILNHTKYNSL